MNYFKRSVVTFTLLCSLPALWADNDLTHVTDTIRTYNIDEVVITSSIKETNDLRKLPGSVSILSPRTINNRQVYALKDISSFVPNLYMPDYGSRQTSAIYIRGVGARSSGQSIGLYVDNVPFLDKSAFDFELMDIQRIEVLRGPQGTLYGRNAMGSIINIYTLSPLDYQGTRINLTAGNHGTYKAKFSHYARMSDNFGLAIAQYYDRNDGYFKNEYTGENIDKSKAMGTRLRLDWRVSPFFKAGYSISYDYTDQGAFAYGFYDKETGNIHPVNINDPSSYNRRVLTNNLSLEYKTDYIILTSTTGYQYLKDDMLMDQDFTPRSVFTLNQKQNQKAFSEEITLKSNHRNNYQWSVGLYGFYNDLHTEGPVTFKEDGIKDIFQPVFSNLSQSNPGMPDLIVTDESIYIPGTFETPSKGFALYHQSTYNNLFIRGLSVTAGVRLDYEKQKMHYISESSIGMAANIMGAVRPLPRDTSRMDARTSQDFWQVLPKVSLKYECTPRTFTYLSVAKGYKTGGYNVQMSADVMQGQMQYDMMSKYAKPETAAAYKPASIDSIMSYNPEHSWNYELGIRSELIPDALETELTLFYTDIRDLQLTQFVGSGSGRILTNAGKARSYGVEASVKYRITSAWTADMNYGYTHATFRDYLYEASQTEKIDCKGNYVPYTPRHTLNVGLQYSKLFYHGIIDQFTAAAQMSGTGNIYWTELNDISQKFYATVNAKAGVRKGMVKLDVWSRNLTDTRYPAFYFESFGNPFIQKGKPFQIGVDLGLTF
ncbi:MAG: TonB-dependent receptor [Tannerellaceae bacterium]|nr:TonB-dependent receptor [Tannerellaceae bacterium]